MASQELDPRLESEVLERSGRRCCICFVINDSQAKQGQITYLDGNTQNNTFQNLVFLCSVHYAQYNAQTMQNRSWTIPQVVNLRERLYEARDNLRMLWFTVAALGGETVLGLCILPVLSLVLSSSLFRSIYDGLFLTLFLAGGTICIYTALFAPDSTIDKFTRPSRFDFPTSGKRVGWFAFGVMLLGAGAVLLRLSILYAK